MESETEYTPAIEPGAEKCTKHWIANVVAYVLHPNRPVESDASLCTLLNAHTHERDILSPTMIQRRMDIYFTRGAKVRWADTEKTKVYYNYNTGLFLCGRSKTGERVKLDSVSKVRLDKRKRADEKAALAKKGPASDSEYEDPANKQFKQTTAENAYLGKKVAASYSEKVYSDDSSSDVESDFSYSGSQGSAWEDDEFANFKEDDTFYLVDLPPEVNKKYLKFLEHHKVSYFRDESRRVSESYGFNNDGRMLRLVATPNKNVAEVRLYGMEHLDLTWLVPISFLMNNHFPKEICVDDTHLPSPTKTICWCHVKSCQQAP